MVKSDLIARLAKDHPHLTARDVERVVGVILDAVTDQLAGGGRVELRGFGTFSVKRRASRSGRNPRTGELVEVPAKAAPAFRCGKDLRHRLNVAGDG